MKVKCPSVRTIVATSLLAASGIALASSAGAAPTLRAQITSAVTAGDAEHYVKIVSANTGPGESQTITSMAGPGMGIQVLNDLGSSDHMTVEYVDHNLYAKASLGFLEGTFGLAPSVASSVINKWTKVATNNPAYVAVYSAVTITSAMSFVAGSGPVKSGQPTVVDGIKVKELQVAISKSSESPAGTETLFITYSGKPLPIETKFVGSGYTSKMTYSQWGKKFKLKAPTNSLNMPSAQTG
jgi:hypothetical protein